MTENEVFYKFTNNSSHTRGFTWAFGIVARSKMVDRRCSQCGTITEYPSGAFDVIVEGGSKYPDVLGCGEYPFLIVSEAVVAAWWDAGVTSFHTYPVGIAEVQSKKLRDQPAPRYFRIEIDGRCRIDLAASGMKVDRYCAKCHHLVTRPMVAPGFRMVPGSWDGSPLFRDIELYPRVSFCTQVVLDIARERRFTNFRFEPMEGPFASGKGIDYLRGKAKS